MLHREVRNFYLMMWFYSFEAQLPGTTQDHLQIFNIEMKAKMKSHQMPEQVTTLLCPEMPNCSLYLL